MTRVTVYLQDGAPVGFVCAGHAGYAAHGSDIVCAALSALTATCANALEKLAGVTPETREDVRKGERAVFLPEGLSPQALHDATLLLRAFQLGAEEIAKAYPKYAAITLQNIQNP